MAPATDPDEKAAGKVSSIERQAVAFADEHRDRFVIDRLVLTCQPRDCRIPSRVKPRLCEIKQASFVSRAHGAADRHNLPRVAVGTVDKFQGKEAAIAIYSMATSSPDDAPRGLAFLYDRHRLNVATSRARCVSVVVSSPTLLRPACKTPAHLRMASALARFIELATTTWSSPQQVNEGMRA